MTLGAWLLHRTHFELAFRLLLHLATLAFMGVATVLFHATLRYQMQLLDEMAIWYLILQGAWCLYEREATAV